MGYRVGVDVGGTFTDVICVTPAGEVVLDKTPTTLDDQFSGVMNGLGQLAERFGLTLAVFCSDLDILVHGTTTADNTMIEMNGTATGLLVTEGHRDEIELRRCHKEEIWDPNYPGPTPIARRHAGLAIGERVNFEGAVLKPLDEDAARRGDPRAARRAGRRSDRDLPSLVHPASRARAPAGEIVAEEAPDLTPPASADVLPRIGEYSRMLTTAVNAFLGPEVAQRDPVAGVDPARRRARPRTLPDAVERGLASVGEAARTPVSFLALGPRRRRRRLDAGRRGARAEPNVVTADMGGTSFDVGLVADGRPLLRLGHL